MALTIPQFEDYLRSLGITSQNNDGEMRYFGSGEEPQRYSQGMISEMQGDPLSGYQNQQMRSQGYIPLPRDQDAQWFNNRYGKNFSSGEDYAKWLYGGGSVETGPDGQQYFKTPNGVDNYVNKPLDYDAPDSKMGQAVKMGILGLAGAGLTGYLPGVEGAFGAGAAGAGAAGGLSQAELAAMIETGTSGFAGAGLETAGLLGNGLSAAQYAGLQAGGMLNGSGGVAGLTDSTWGVNQASTTEASTPTNFTDYINSGSINGSAATTPPAIPGAEFSGNGVGLTESALAGLSGASSATSALSRIMDGSATASDWTSLAGSGLSAGLGVLGANQQADAYKDVADKYLALGAPYRDKLSASYAPGFSMADQPDFMNALNLSADAVARATSTKANTFDPGAQMEMQKYVSGSLALPQLNTYRSQLGTFGNLGTNVAGTTDAASAGQTGNMYNAIGYGLGQITQPQSSTNSALSDLLKRYSTGSTASF